MHLLNKPHFARGGLGESFNLLFSLDEGLSSRTYFNVKELLVSAGGEREPSSLRTKTNGLFFLQELPSPSSAPE